MPISACTSRSGRSRGLSTASGLEQVSWVWEVNMTKGKKPDGIVFTNADPRYAGKLDDPQGGDMTMLM